MSQNELRNARFDQSYFEFLLTEKNNLFWRIVLFVSHLESYIQEEEEICRLP